MGPTRDLLHRARPPAGIDCVECYPFKAIGPPYQGLTVRSVTHYRQQVPSTRDWLRRIWPTRDWLHRARPILSDWPGIDCVECDQCKKTCHSLPTSIDSFERINHVERGEQRRQAPLYQYWQRLRVGQENRFRFSEHIRYEMIEMIWQCTLIVSSVADPGPEKIRYGSVSESRPNFDMDPDPGKTTRTWIQTKKGFSTRKILKIWFKTLISHVLCVCILLNYHFSIKNNLN